MGSITYEDLLGVMPKYMSYEKDPNVDEMQEYLKGYGLNIMGGEIPDYYKAIGEMGSKEFEDMLGLAKRDVMGAGYEAAAKLGKRGPRLTESISSAVADIIPELRYKDYERSLTGKQFLLGTGEDMLTGVRSAGLTREGMENQQKQNLANMMMSLGQSQIASEQAKEAEEASFWSDVISATLGAAGTIGGMMIGGPAGAVAGGTLGSAAAGGAFAPGESAMYDKMMSIGNYYPY